MHTYMYHDMGIDIAHCFKIHFIIIIIIDVKNKEFLLHFITLTAKISKKNKRRPVNEKFS